MNPQEAAHEQYEGNVHARIHGRLTLTLQTWYIYNERLEQRGDLTALLPSKGSPRQPCSVVFPADLLSIRYCLAGPWAKGLIGA